MKLFLNIFLLYSLLNSFTCTFQANIFSQINTDKNGQNLIISPLSIYQVLSLLTNGAKGSAQSELLSTLGSKTISELNDINYKILSTISSFSSIDIANAVMTKFKPLENFCAIAHKYSASLELLESVEQVNEWCNEKTHGKIKKIIDKLNPETIMILLNAVYFKGNWLRPFDKYFNEQMSFYNFAKEKKAVDSMIQIEHFRYYQNSDLQIVELPFKEDFMSALIILPSKQEEINTFIKNKISQEAYLDNIMNKLDYAKVQLQMPKFEITFEEKLNEVIKKLGINKIFNAIEGDLTGLFNDQNLFVNQIIHKTYLKVNEDGTEAAAVTMVSIAMGMAMGEPEIVHIMKVDRPFLFLLKNWQLPAGYDMVFMAKIEEL